VPEGWPDRRARLQVPHPHGAGVVSGGQAPAFRGDRQVIDRRAEPPQVQRSRQPLEDAAEPAPLAGAAGVEAYRLGEPGQRGDGVAA
jgi:hypothetical protein